MQRVEYGQLLLEAERVRMPAHGSDYGAWLVEQGVARAAQVNRETVLPVRCISTIAVLRTGLQTSVIEQGCEKGQGQVLVGQSSQFFHHIWLDVMDWASLVTSNLLL